MLDTFDEVRSAYQHFIEYYVRIPLTVVTLVIGFLLEFLVCLPFFLIVCIDRLGKKKT